MPLKWGAIWQDIGFFTVMISIYAGDGTVAVTHGGIEIGQGINTKVIVNFVYLKYYFKIGGSSHF